MARHLNQLDIDRLYPLKLVSGFAMKLVQLVRQGSSSGNRLNRRTLMENQPDRQIQSHGAIPKAFHGAGSTQDVSRGRLYPKRFTGQALVTILHGAQYRKALEEQ